MIGSVSRWRWWWSAAESLIIAGAEAVPVLLKCWRGHGRVAESRVTLHVGCEALGNVAACGFNSILIALLSGWTELGRRRWGSVYDRLRVRTSGQRKWKSQSNEACDLSGGHFSKPQQLDWMSRPCCGATVGGLNPKLLKVLRGAPRDWQPKLPMETRSPLPIPAPTTKVLAGSH